MMEIIFVKEPTNKKNKKEQGQWLALGEKQVKKMFNNDCFCADQFLISQQTTITYLNDCFTRSRKFTMVEKLMKHKEYR